MTESTTDSAPSTSSSVVIVGASLAGLRTAEMLRRKGHSGRIVLVGEEPHLPYDRPPLSKQVLTGEWEPEKIALRRKPYEDLELDLRLDRRATSLDASARRVRLDDGETLEADHIVIATGARARLLPDQPPPAEGVYSLRTLDDSLSIREAIRPGARVVVVGAGFIGAEVASSALSRDAKVTVLEAQSAPLVKALGEEIGAVLAGLMRDRGVDLRCGTTVSTFVRDEGSGKVTGVRIRPIADDGDGEAEEQQIDCDVCVVGIGAIPNTEWLEGSGLEIRDGVLCDERCVAAPGVYAIGDVARFRDPRTDEPTRLEHWSNAVEGARSVSDQILKGDDASPYEHVPTFWSDQFGIKIQGAGRPEADDEMRVVAGSLEEEKFCALFGRDGTLSGVLAFSMPPKLVAYQRLLAKNASWAEALEGQD